MLKRLIKYDLKDTWTSILLICAVTIIARFALKILGSAYSDLLVLLCLLCDFILLVCSILPTLYICMNYYKSLYTNEAYLTFTLPVKRTCIISSKIIVGSIWLAITSVPSILVILGDEINGFAAIPYLILWEIINLLICFLSITVGRSWFKKPLTGIALCYMGFMFLFVILLILAYYITESLRWNMSPSGFGILVEICMTIFIIFLYGANLFVATRKINLT